MERVFRCSKCQRICEWREKKRKLDGISEEGILKAIKNKRVGKST